MAILGKIIKNGIKFREIIRPKKINPLKRQRRILLKLLLKANKTEFGKKYNFLNILEETFLDTNNVAYEMFKKNVPVYDYTKLYADWWHKCHKGEKNITWPGKVKYFALSSGTSDSASKYIPVTKDMVKAIQKTSIRQILALDTYKNLKSKVFEKGYLMLGGSIDLNYIDGHFEGDLSGITAGNIPFWFEKFYKPGKNIAQTKDWEEKLRKITEKAKDWDIGFVAGVPAWVQLLLERIINTYKLENIHDLWPNLSVFAHGGVSFEPYKHSFEKLLGRKIEYVETYLASEGFLAYQTKPGQDMALVLNNGIFFEFIPFNDENFDEDGNMVEKPQTYMIHEVEDGKEYALLISTVSGAWRYLIGDTVRITNKKLAQIQITGRTKHFLSLCGEHLSIDNMNKAVEMAAQHLNIDIREFTVIGKKTSKGFSHNWYLGIDENISETELKEFIDKSLFEINDDYAVERKHALNELVIKIVPVNRFYEFMDVKGKTGGQHKFPRVIKKENLIKEWENFVL